MATRLTATSAANADEPIVITSRSAKFLAAFWASLADYMPGYVGRHGIARLDPPNSDLPLLLFTEDRTEPATGTSGIVIEADDLTADVDALERVGARVVSRSDRDATMSDPEGNHFTVVAKADARSQ
jgi:hypothetical protein